jgi:hypothetical protein
MPAIIDSTWKPGIGEALVIDDEATLFEGMASVLVEDWTGVEVEVKVLGMYGCGPTKFAGSKSGGNGV